MGDVVIIALVVSSVAFAALGVWLLAAQRTSKRSRLATRLRGVKQVKRYELGDTLAESREQQLKKREERKEALKRQAFSDIPALDRVLKKSSFAEKLNGMLIQVQLPLTVTAFVALCCLLGVMGVLVTVIWRREFDPLMALIFGVTLGVMPYAFLRVKVARRLKRFGTQLPDALDLLSSSVKAGQSLNAAIQNVADEMPDPVGDEFKILADELTFGVTFENALQHLTIRISTPDVKFFATAMVIQKEVGGNLSEVIDGLQKTIRERFRILGQVKTLTAQGKLSGLIVGMLPVALLILIYVLNREYMIGLFTTKLGHILLGVAAGMELLGALLIRKIVSIKV